MSVRDQTIEISFPIVQLTSSTGEATQKKKLTGKNRTAAQFRWIIKKWLVFNLTFRKKNIFIFPHNYRNWLRLVICKLLLLRLYLGKMLNEVGFIIALHWITNIYIKSCWTQCLNVNNPKKSTLIRRQSWRCTLFRAKIKCHSHSCVHDVFFLLLCCKDVKWKKKRFYHEFHICAHLR